MSERVRRRRSLRLNRPPLVPVLADTEVPDCLNDDTEDNPDHCNSTVYIAPTDCGSFWEEVDNNGPKKRKSRRSNIGFYIARNADEDAKLDKELKPESPDIELPRRPCPEAESCMETPLSFSEDIKDVSDSKTPGDTSLPNIQTPSSASLGLKKVVQDQSERFDDYIFNMNTPAGSQAEMSCPPSCEDESEDSLLICTPDLSKFKKNIRFKCSLDFSEFDQTPSKAEISLDKSQDSIHESPIVGVIYDKLKASDVVRRRRSTSFRPGRPSSYENLTPKTTAPRRLITSESKKTKTPEEKTSKSLNMSDRSSSQSVINSTPSSGTYTSCVEDRLEDFLSVSSAEPSPLGSPLPSAIASSQSSPRLGSVDRTQSSQPMCVASVQASKPSPVASSQASQATSGVSSQSSPVTISVVPQNESTTVSTDPVSEQLDVLKQSVTKDKVINDEPELDKEYADTTEVITSSNVQNNLEILEPSEKVKTPVNEPTIPQQTSDEPSEDVQDTENKSKERNIASDVCEMFRSLARKFSGNRKKKRKSVGNKKTKTPVQDIVKSSLLDEGSTLLAADDSAGIFSFRKEPKLPDQLPELSPGLSEKTPELGSGDRKSLDFTPYLTENTDTIITPDSPVWKLQSKHPELVEIVEKNVDISETVLQEQPTNVEDMKPKKRGKPKRRSIEITVLQQECEDFQKTHEVPVEEEEEENVAVRRSRRQRRSSLEMFRYQSQTPVEITEESLMSDSPESQESDKEKPKKTRGRKKALQVQEENLEDLYRNKNYTLPTERMWETVFESPEKTKQPNLLQSKRKYRRTIAFDTIPPAKIRKRLQKAATQGWDVTGKKRMSISIDDVKTKIALLASEIDS